MKPSGSRFSSAVIERIAAFDQLPQEALLNVHEIAALASRSAPSIWRDAKDGSLATPIKVGRNSTRWRVADVRVYLAGRV